MLDISQTVSIGVPCYNRAGLLSRLLSQLVVQTYSDVEIIVSDNCSPDPEVFQVAIRFAERDTRVRAVRQPLNLGAIANHEFVKNRATGRYFFWAHDDDEFPPDYVEICLRHLNAAPSAVLVGPSCDRYLNGSFWFSHGTWSNAGHRTYQRLRDLMPVGLIDHARFEQYLSGVFVLEAAPKELSRDFKAQFHFFFELSEAGEIIHAPELKLIKHTTQEQVSSYSNYLTDSPYKRHRSLRWFSLQMQECVPFTIQMLNMVIRSSRLTVIEKVKLVCRCLGLFAWYPVRTEVYHQWLRPKINRLGRFPSWIRRRVFKVLCNTSRS